MKNIAPIETIYKGCRFRSRLEARWAVFFDAAGIEWKYEPDGYSRVVAWDEGGQAVRSTSYLPDFWLPATQTWVEVKGSDEALQLDAPKLSEILDFGSPMPGLDESYSECSKHRTSGLMLLGDIPNQDKWGTTLHPIVQHHQGLHIAWAYFCGIGVLRAPLNSGLNQSAEEVFYSRVGIPATRTCIESDPSQWTCKSELIEMRFSQQRIVDAYMSARQSRFEHGQVGAPTSWR